MDVSIIITKIYYYNKYLLYIFLSIRLRIKLLFKIAATIINRCSIRIYNLIISCPVYNDSSKKYILLNKKLD